MRLFSCIVESTEISHALQPSPLPGQTSVPLCCPRVVVPGQPSLLSTCSQSLIVLCFSHPFQLHTWGRLGPSLALAWGPGSLWLGSNSWCQTQLLPSVPLLILHVQLGCRRGPVSEEGEEPWGAQRRRVFLWSSLTIFQVFTGRKTEIY